MPFLDMTSELVGSVPKLPIDFARTLVNRAWTDVRRQNLWSFLLFDSNWTSPPVINSGKVTTTRGLNQVTFDATASAALIAGSLAPTIITQRQFRQGISTIYNIWALDATVPTALVLTLDRPYAEASGVGQSYAVFQCYYPAPMRDFLNWVSVRDMINFINLFTNKTRGYLDQTDPQRTWYYFPTDVVYYQQDQNPLSPTYGFPCFELWGSPQNNITYQLYGMRRGTPLVLPSDQLPPAVGEDCVLALAKKYAYEWAEANKGDTPRNSGTDWKYLMGSAGADYLRLFREYRRQDRETVDNWFSLRRVSLYGKYFAQYSTFAGQGVAYPGVYLS